MLRGCQAKRFKGLGTAEEVVAQRARKKSRQHGMVGLPNQDELIAVHLNNHGAALFRSGGFAMAPAGERRPHRPRGWPTKTLRTGYYAPAIGHNPAPSWIYRGCGGAGTLIPWDLRP